MLALTVDHGAAQVKPSVLASGATTSCIGCSKQLQSTGSTRQQPKTLRCVEAAGPFQAPWPHRTLRPIHTVIARNPAHFYSQVQAVQDKRIVKDDIDWAVVADKVGTRSNIQCLHKWYEVAPKPEDQGASH